MSIARVTSACVESGKVWEICVEADVRPGLPIFRIIGLPDRSVAEARERVMSAIKNSGLRFPKGRVTVNLSPSALHKRGTGFDLAIATAVLVAGGVWKATDSDIWHIGELQLDGTICEPWYQIPVILEAERQNRCVVMAKRRMIESLHVSQGVELSRLADYPRCGDFSELKATLARPKLLKEYLLDEILGLDHLKRAAAIAIAGQYSVLLVGPAGAGKTMLAQAAHQLMPPLSSEDAVRLAEIRSFAGSSPGIEYIPPFIADSAIRSSVQLIGREGVPGLVSQAYGGMLFLDEFTLIPAAVRESLRQPMQEGCVRFSFPSHTAVFPSTPNVWAACNACPCGKTPDECACTAPEKVRYEKRLTQPMRERFSLHLYVPQYLQSQSGGVPGMQGAELARSVARVRTIKHKRLDWSDQASRRLQEACEAFACSMRVRTSLARIVETITYLDGQDTVSVAAVEEALQYRPRTIA